MAPDRYDLPVCYVDGPDSLGRALSHWFQAHLLSVDIECSLTGVHHCVMALAQVATHDQVWLVDPIALGPLAKPTFHAMAQIPWICHDFSGDGVVFKRIYDVVPVSVMDTMVLSRVLGYPQPGLKTMAKLKLGVDIPKEEQDSNWMIRPLRASQMDYAARDATLLLPLLRALAREAESRRDEPDTSARLANLPQEMAGIMHRIRHYHPPKSSPIVQKVRSMGLGPRAEEQARKLTELRLAWGNEGDVAAVMELGNRWILARLQHPPRSREALERCIPNPRFRQRRAQALWDVLGDERD